MAPCGQSGSRGGRGLAAVGKVGHPCGDRVHLRPKYLAGDPAVGKEHDPVRARGGDRIVRHHHDRRAGRPHQRAEQAEHLGASHQVQRAGGLIGEDDARGADQRAGYRDALLLPAGELPGPRPALAGQPDLVERCRYGRPPRVFAGQSQRQRHVVGGAELGQKVERLEDESDPLAPYAGQGPLRSTRQVRPVQCDRARRGPVQARRAVQQRGLARARGPHHGGEAASLEAQRDVVERGGGGTPAAVPLGHPGQADHVSVPHDDGIRLCGAPGN